MSGPRKSSKVLWRKSHDGTFLFHTVTGELCRVNKTGARVWELLDGTRAPDEIVEHITREFKNAEAARVRTALQAFLGNLAARGLLESQ